MSIQADRLYLGDDLIYEASAPVSSPINVIPFSSPYVIPAHAGSPLSFIDSSTVSATPAKSGYAVAVVNAPSTSTVSPPTGFTLLTSASHPSESFLSIRAFGGWVVAGQTYSFTVSPTSGGAIMRFIVHEGISEASPVVGVSSNHGSPNSDIFTGDVEGDSEGTVAIFMHVTRAVDRDPGYHSSVAPTWGWYTGVNARQLSTGRFSPMGGLPATPSLRLDPAGAFVASMVVLRAATGERPSLPADITARLGTAADAALESALGHAYIILKDGEVVLTRESGTIRTPVDEGARPFTVTQKVDVASISKVISLLLVHRLAHVGLIDLDAPLYGYIQSRWPTPPAAGISAVTIRSVLRMVEGQENSPLPYIPGQTLRANVQSWLNGAATRPQGDRLIYSNLNYSAITALVEEVTGQDFETHAQEVFGPYFDVLTSCPSVYEPLMYGVNAPPTQGGSKSPVDLGGLGAAGLYLSVEDLAQLARLLRSDDLMPREQVRRALLDLPMRSWLTQFSVRGGAAIPNGSWNEGNSGIRAMMWLGPDGYDVVYICNGPIGGVVTALRAVMDEA